MSDGRVAVKVTRADNATIGVITPTASRELRPGYKEGGIGLRFDGSLWVEGKPVHTVKGFRTGDTLGVAVLSHGGGRVVAFFVNSEEVTRYALPDGEYRFAVGGDGDHAAFEMVDAAAAAAFWD